MEAKISTYLIGIIMFVFFILGGITLINILGDSDNTFIDNNKYEAYSDITNKYDDLNASISEISAPLNSDVDTGTVGVLSSLIQTAWNSLKALPNTLAFMNSVYTGMAEFFGIPAFIPGLVIMIILVIIIFTIFGAIFQNAI